MKKRVLVIGSGKRVKGAIIPALWCLQDSFEIVSVYSRSIKDISFFDGKLNLTTINSLEKVDFKKIDMIMMAITTKEVPKALKVLSLYDTAHIILMIDTPVLEPRNFLTFRFFRNFKKVLASEDTIALPPHILARSLIEQGRIGKLKNIYFFHNGYTYHGLASLKMLVGKGILGFWNRRFAKGITLKEFYFGDVVRAFMYEPRDYSKCKFLIEGEKGFIADYDYPGSSVIRIGYLKEGDLYKGLSLDSKDVPLNALDKKYISHIENNVYDISLVNSMKIRALMDLISEAEKENSPFHYGPFTAFLDNIVMLIAGKIGYL